MAAHESINDEILSNFMLPRARSFMLSFKTYAIVRPGLNNCSRFDHYEAVESEFSKLKNVLEVLFYYLSKFAKIQDCPLLWFRNVNFSILIPSVSRNVCYECET